MHVKALVAAVAVAALALAGCGGGGGSSASSGGGSLPGLSPSHPAAEIAATWSGGAKGPPTNVKAFTPSSWKGNLCPPSTVGVWFGNPKAPDGDNNLWLSNSCSIPIMFFVCAFAGNLIPNGIGQCAPIPTQTQLGVFSVYTYAGGSSPGVAGNSMPGNPAIEIYWCADAEQFVAPPAFSSVGCV